MGFLKKDVNIGLIFLVVIVLVLLAGLTIYYQSNLKNILTENKDKSKQLEQISAKLISEEAKTQEIYEVKEKTRNDKEFLERGYNEIKNEKQDLEEENRVLSQELVKLNLDLEKTKAELVDKTNKFNLLQERFIQIEDNLERANDEISKLIARVDELCGKVGSEGDEEC